MKFKNLFAVLCVLFCMTFVITSIATAKTGPPGYYKKLNGADAGEVVYWKNGKNLNPQSEWELVQPYKAPCFGGACEDALALADSGVMIISNFDVVDFDSPMAWGAAGGKDLELHGTAFATGADKRIWFFKIPGYAWANVDLSLIANVYTCVFTTGEKLDTGGLSMTYAKSTGILDFEGSAIAIGSNGCPQWASVNISGIFNTTVGAHSLATGPNASFAQTWGEGMTSVKVSGWDSDFDKYGFLTAAAHAKLEGWVMVVQDIFVSSYVSPDGTTAANFGIVKGGWAMAGGDANLEGIRAQGSINQQGQATDGIGSAAYGSSNASFNGARGQVYDGRCVDFAKVGGVAVVTGYNNVTNTGSGVVVTSKQTAFATTGNGGIVQHQNDAPR